MYEINKGIPLPPIKRSSGPRKYPIETMEVGDQIFIPGRPSKSVSAYISRISKGLPGKFTARACFMAKDSDGNWQPCDPGGPPATEGTGVWRIE